MSRIHRAASAHASPASWARIRISRAVGAAMAMRTAIRADAARSAAVMAFAVDPLIACRPRARASSALIRWIKTSFRRVLPAALSHADAASAKCVSIMLVASFHLDRRRTAQIVPVTCRFFQRVFPAGSCDRCSTIQAWSMGHGGLTMSAQAGRPTHEAPRSRRPLCPMSPERRYRQQERERNHHRLARPPAPRPALLSAAGWMPWAIHHAARPIHHAASCHRKAGKRALPSPTSPLMYGGWLLAESQGTPLSHAGGNDVTRSTQAWLITHHATRVT